jgi:hypothetical protein
MYKKNYYTYIYKNNCGEESPNRNHIRLVYMGYLVDFRLNNTYA